eukprot:jgi/Ulvmu1/1863/UM012_0019.1
MEQAQAVADALTRQEQMLEQLLLSSRSLHSRMQSVETAIGIEGRRLFIRPDTADIQAAREQPSDGRSPVPQREQFHQHTDYYSGNRSMYENLQWIAECAHGNSLRVGEAVGKGLAEPEDEQYAPSGRQEQAQQQSKSFRRGVIFRLRPASFKKVLSGKGWMLRDDLQPAQDDGLDEAVPFHTQTRKSSAGDLMRAMSKKFDETDNNDISDIFDDLENSMWDRLTLTDFWQHLQLFAAVGKPMPFRHKLRMITQIPHAVDVDALVTMFLEEDTVGVLTNIVQPVEFGFVDGIVLFLFGVVHPGSIFKIFWDFFMMATLFTVLIATPFVICFDIGYARISPLGIWEAIIDASFWMDIMFNFRTAYMEPSVHVDDALITSYTRITLRYLRGFFLLDFISTVPWDLVNESMGLAQLFKISKVGKLVRVMRMLKITKMLRVFKAPKALKQLELRLGRVLTRVLWLVCSVVFILHIFACIFHFSALVSNSETTWVDSSGIVDASNIIDLYVTSMYWAMSTMATVGYGDVTPIQIAEKLVSMFGMLAGVTVFAYIMSTVSVLLSSINAQSIRTAERQRQLDSFCRAHKIPPWLAMKLSQFYEYVLPRQVHEEDLKLLSGLSGSLRQQVLLTMNSAALDKLPFLRSKHPQFLEYALTQLKLEYYGPGECVIWQGDLSTEMYFVIEGKLEVRVQMAHPPSVGDDTGDAEQLGDAASAGAVAESRVVPASDPVTESTDEPGADKGETGGALSPEVAELAKVRRLSRQLSKMRLRRPKKDIKVSNRMIGQDKSPYKKLGKLLAGEHFGEVACWTGERRTASVVTITSCELYCLQRKALLHLVRLWPDLADELNFKMVNGSSAKMQSAGHHNSLGSKHQSIDPQLTMLQSSLGQQTSARGLLLAQRSSVKDFCSVHSDGGGKSQNTSRTPTCEVAATDGNQLPDHVPASATAVVELPVGDRGLQHSISPEMIESSKNDDHPATQQECNEAYAESGTACLTGDVGTKPAALDLLQKATPSFQTLPPLRLGAAPLDPNQRPT